MSTKHTVTDVKRANFIRDALAHSAVYTAEEIGAWYDNNARLASQHWNTWLLKALFGQQGTEGKKS